MMQVSPSSRSHRSQTSLGSSLGSSLNSSVFTVSPVLEKLAEPRSITSALLAINKTHGHELKASLDEFQRTATGNLHRISTALSTETQIRHRRQRTARARRERGGARAGTAITIPTVEELFQLNTKEMMRLAHAQQQKMKKKLVQPEWDAKFMHTHSLSLPALREPFKSKSEINYERSMARYMFRIPKDTMAQGMPHATDEVMSPREKRSYVPPEIAEAVPLPVELADTDARPSFIPALGVLSAAYLHGGLIDSPRRKAMTEEEKEFGEFSRYARSSNAREIEEMMRKQELEMAQECKEEDRRTSYYRKKPSAQHDSRARRSIAGDAMRQVTVANLTKGAERCRAAWESIVKDLRQAGKRIEYGHITEIGSYEHPPKAVMKLMGYICLLLGMKPNWLVMKIHLFKDHAVLLRFFRQVEPLTVPLEQIVQAHTYRMENLKALNPTAIRGISNALLPFARWIETFNMLAEAMIEVHILRNDRRRSGVHAPEVSIQSPLIAASTKSTKDKGYGNSRKSHPLQIMSTSSSSKKMLYEESRGDDDEGCFTHREMRAVEFQVSFFEDLDISVDHSSSKAFWNRVKDIADMQDIAETAKLEEEKLKQQKADSEKEKQVVADLPDVNAKSLRLAAENCLRSMMFPDQQPRQLDSQGNRKASLSPAMLAGLKSRDGIPSLGALGKAHISMRSFRGINGRTPVSSEGSKPASRGDTKTKKKNKKRGMSISAQSQRTAPAPFLEQVRSTSLKTISRTVTDDSDIESESGPSADKLSLLEEVSPEFPMKKISDKILLKSSIEDLTGDVVDADKALCDQEAHKEKCNPIADNTMKDTSVATNVSTEAPGALLSLKSTKSYQSTGILSGEATPGYADLTSGVPMRSKDGSQSGSAYGFDAPGRLTSLKGMQSYHSKGTLSGEATPGYADLTSGVPASKYASRVESEYGFDGSTAVDDEFASLWAGVSHPASGGMGTDGVQRIDDAMQMEPPLNNDALPHTNINADALVDAPMDSEVHMHMHVGQLGILKSTKEVAAPPVSSSKKMLSFQHAPEDMRFSDTAANMETFGYPQLGSPHTAERSPIGLHASVGLQSGEALDDASETSYDLDEDEYLFVGEKRSSPIATVVMI